MRFKQLAVSIIVSAILLSTFLALTSPIHAHTIVSPYTVPLAMGVNNIPVGFVRVWNDDKNLYVLFEMDAESYPNYAMSETHLNVSKSSPSWSAPGSWDYGRTYTPYATSDLYTIPLSSIDGGVSAGTKIYLMAHAAICDKNSSLHIGSAYGSYFKGSFSYTIQEKPPEKPELSIVKTGPLKAYPGGTYLYTIIVTNVGSIAVNNVNVTDFLPNGVAPAHPEAPGTPTGVYSQGGNMVNWTIGTLGIGGFVVITLEVVFDASLTPSTTVTNVARAVGTGADTVEATCDTIIIAGPELNITKVGPTKGYPGGILVYTITVTNIGNETAYDVNVTDTIDLSLVEYVSSSPAGVVSGNNILWSLGTVIKGTSIPITLTVRVLPNISNGTQITNNVEVKWEDDTGQDYGPESDTWITTVFSNPLLSVVKTGPLNAYPNQIIEYTISVRNLGGSPALNVNVSDRLPDGVKYDSATPTLWLNAANNQWVNWTIPEIPVDGLVTLKIYVNMTIALDICQYVTNNVTVTWEDTLGRAYGPIWDAMVTRACRRPLLQIDKAGDSCGIIGQILSFTINVTNVGGSNATNVKVWDDLPYNLTLYANSNPPYDFYDAYSGRIMWEFDKLTPGETKSITLTVNVTDVKYDGVWVFNNVYANWTDDERNLYGPVTDIHPIQLFIDPYAEVSKSGPIEAYAGTTITYNIMLKNPTESQLNNVMLVDYLPSHVSYLNSTPPGNYDIVKHAVTWSLSLGPGEERIFQIRVKIDPYMLGGEITNEAVVTWPDGSDSDRVATQIKEKKLPVGGIIIAPNITAPAIIAAITVGALIIVARKKLNAS